MNLFSETIKRYFTNSCSENDIKNLFLWLNSEKGLSEIDEMLYNSWDSFDNDINIDIDSEKLLKNIRRGIKSKKSFELRRNLTTLLPYAAMLLILLGSVFFFFSYNRNISDMPEGDKRFTSVITENGQRSKVILPDSSVVWLNSGTSLSYNDNFIQNQRKVIVDGQAFFTVYPDEKNPFTVQCNDLLITVLGTTFDVNSYPESGKVSVMLKSGQVELSHMKISSINYTLSPGELASYDTSDSSINISKADSYQYSSWKDGILIFRDEPISSVFENLARWYNVNIEVTDEEVYKSIFTGTIQNESYEQIFKLLEFSCPVECNIQHNLNSESIPKIIISKK